MSDARDPQLSAAYRASLDPSGCPDEERLAALAIGELAGAERERLGDHVVRCERCAASYRELRELHEAALEIDPGLVRSSDRAPASPLASKAWWLSAAVAAALLLAVALVAPWDDGLSGEGPDPGALRGAGDPTAATPQGRLTAVPTRFSWPAQALADGYTVELFDRRAQSLWSVRTESATLEPGAELTARILGGEGYYWVVHVGGNVATRKLGPYRFELE